MESKALAVSSKKRRRSNFFLMASKSVYVDDVLASVDTGQKTFLTRVDKVDDSRHDGPRYCGGQESVVGVSDTKGTGVGDKTGNFFWEEKEETVVETIRGGMTPRDG
jgi:hypothetical protein